jgi:hypothetical protein
MELALDKAVQAVLMDSLETLLVRGALMVAVAVVCNTEISLVQGALVQFALFGVLTERSHPLIQETYDGTLY